LKGRKESSKKASKRDSSGRAHLLGSGAGKNTVKDLQGKEVSVTLLKNGGRGGSPGKVDSKSQERRVLQRRTLTSPSARVFVDSAQNRCQGKGGKNLKKKKGKRSEGREETNEVYVEGTGNTTKPKLSCGGSAVMSAAGWEHLPRGGRREAGVEKVPI